MTNCERLRRTLNFESVDRLPMWEWATWWDKTIQRWHAEGLPGEIQDVAAISLRIGLDDFRQYWVSPRGPDFERLLPAMQSGGYIPSVDHQTPPGVSLANYRIYLKLLKEYCVKSVGA